MTVVVLPDAPTLAARAADLVADSLSPGDNFALAGGSTPAATYRALRSHTVAWDALTIWLSDERWVAPDHADSNARMALEASGNAFESGLLPIPWGDGISPSDAAARYEAELTDRLGAAGPGLVLLGIGDDCHTASLFPGTDALSVTDRDFVANHVPDKGWRLTATLPFLHRAEHLVFLVQGTGKAAALAEVLNGDGSTPAAMVAQGARRVTWLVDEAAASSL